MKAWAIDLIGLVWGLDKDTHIFLKLYKKA